MKEFISVVLASLIPVCPPPAAVVKPPDVGPVRVAVAPAPLPPWIVLTARLECWIEFVKFEWRDDQYWCIEYWRCEDDSTFTKEYPVG